MSDVDALEPNPLVRAIGKPAQQFTCDDIVDFVKEHHIRRLNLRYLAGDGRLKQLNFVIQSEAQLRRVLLFGERVDGSSLFDFVDATCSDLYIIPRYATAFLNPLETDATPTLEMLCSFFDVDGKPLASAPENILAKAQRSLEAATGCTLQALGELEYYIVSEVDQDYPVQEQRGYHEAAPFAKWLHFTQTVTEALSKIGCRIKYSHAEVGNFIDGDRQMVQHEIEFALTEVGQAADQITLAKWVVRELSVMWGLQVSFSPKIATGQAGSGMHFHTRLMRDGRNAFVGEDGLSDDALRVIGGYLKAAGSLTAFGNPVPVSFLRLVPNQEAPTSICWGERNRSALVRVPLGWHNVDTSMAAYVNPAQPPVDVSASQEQTIEIRSPDGAANVHLLLAGLVIAAREGLTQEGMREFAVQARVEGDASEVAGLEQLPTSCVESAERLLADREVYEAEDVFPRGFIDSWAQRLAAYGDQDLRQRLEDDPQLALELAEEYFHIG